MTNLQIALFPIFVCLPFQVYSSFCDHGFPTVASFYKLLITTVTVFAKIFILYRVT